MAYGKELFDRDLVKSSEPKPCPEDQLEKLGFIVPGKKLGCKHNCGVRAAYNRD